ncbi:hypothetical protein GGR56DRAFT_677740 [Xylariaceae sp. FL0804]|nr:hypothetical protein GGR56DRAFT_677740 [Xylariaceae sp. FL0804]
MPNRSPEPRSVEHAPPSPSPSLRADEEAHHQDAPAAEPQENTQPEDTNATEFDDGDESDAAPGPNAAKHASTMSFARTSHEVSFDDDSEWNLQRSDTDPFNFMPPNERTNSFPVVPQLTSGPNGGEQTQSSLGSSDLVASGLRNQYEPTTLGGDRIGAEEEESDARFEEGLPLIPQAEPEPAPQTGDVPSDTPQSNFDDPFSQDDGGDDFFTQIHSSSEAQESPFEPALHRKSTTMVIREAMDPAAGAAEADSELPTPIEAMGAKVAEPEAVHDSVVRDGVDNTGGTPRDEAGLGLETEDLDAKWAAAFGDDDDDDGGGFLLDSAEPAKELDPADIFGSDDEGFLDDDAANTADAGPAASSDSQPQPTANNAHSQALPPSIGGRYTPTTLQESPQLVPNPYAPTPPTSQIPQASLHSGSVPPMATGYGVPPPPPSLPNAGQSRAQSFASKTPMGNFRPPLEDRPKDHPKDHLWQHLRCESSSGPGR